MGSMFSKNKVSSQPDDFNDRQMFDEYVNSSERFHDLSGKVVAITGTSEGSLGFYLGEIAIRKNAKLLLLLNRDSDSSQKGAEALKKLADQYAEGSFRTKMQTVTCDLMDFSSVRKASEEVNEIAKQQDGLDVLICNAGIMAKSDKRTDDGFDIQMQTNQLSHFLLVQGVFDTLKLAGEKRGEARLVMQSSAARWFPKKDLEQKFFQKSKPGTLGGDSMFKDLVLGWGGPWTRYHMTKLANACFAMELSKRLLKDVNNKVKVLSAEPGVANSQLFDGAASNDDGAMSSWMGSLMFSAMGQSVENGALPSAMAAFSPQALAGDLWAPKFQEKGGPPVKAIEERSDVDRKAKEILTLTPANQKNVWKWCEEALDIKFEV